MMNIYDVYDITDPDSAGFTAQRTTSFLSIRLGFTLRPVSAVSSRDYWVAHFGLLGTLGGTNQRSYPSIISKREKNLI